MFRNIVNIQILSFFQELRGAWPRNCRSGENLTETGRPRQTQSALICVCHKCIMHKPMQSMPEVHDAKLSGSANCQYANPYSFSFSILNPCTHMPMQCRHIWAYAYICILCNVFASKQIQICISFHKDASKHLCVSISMHIMQDNASKQMHHTKFMQNWMFVLSISAAITSSMMQKSKNILVKCGHFLSSNPCYITRDHLVVNFILILASSFKISSVFKS